MMAGGQITGRHVLVGFVAAFSLIIGVNLVLAWSAVKTFPGLEVKNSYVASQRWNARTDAQDALGWQTDVIYDGGTVRIDLRDRNGAPVKGVEILAMIGRPTTDIFDEAAGVSPTSEGYEFSANLSPGHWQLQITTTRGPAYQVTATLLVPETR